MIDFRYHVVSLVAVFLALATGILLGAGPLQEPIQGQLEGRTEALRDDQQELREANGALQVRVELGDTFTAETAGALVGTGLAGRRVVVLTLPGTGDALREATEASLTAAGAVVSGRVSLQADLYDPDRLPEISQVTDALAAPAPDPTSPTPGLRVARALARALVTTAGTGAAGSDPAGATGAVASNPPGPPGPTGRTGPTDPTDPAGASTASVEPGEPGEPDEQAAALLSGLRELGVIDVDGEPAARASLAVVLAPGLTELDAAATGAPAGDRDTLLLPLLAELDAAGRGVVVAGALGSDTGSGLVAAVRGDGPLDGAVSTVDVAETPQGQVAAMLALAEQERGGAGEYGVGSGVDQLLPPAIARAPAVAP